MPLTLHPDGWIWADARSPAEYFGDALLWHTLAEGYPGWWVDGAYEQAQDCMDAALAGTGL